MSFRSFLDRTVTIETVGRGTRDAYGNRPKGVTTTTAAIRARRDQVAVSEDRADRDEQARTYLYLLEPTDADGEPVTPTGRDRLVDGAETFEILGAPEVVIRRRRVHHLEVRAYRIDG